jgi:uncharacterized protein (TIGR02145 family)
MQLNYLKAIFICAKILFLASYSYAQQGEDLYNTHCKSCHDTHTDGVGPKLFNVRKKWSDGGAMEGSIYKWVNNFQEAAAGDPYAQTVTAWSPTAQSLFPELTVSDINSIFDWVDSQPLPKTKPIPTVNDSNNLFSIIMALIILTVLILSIVVFNRFKKAQKTNKPFIFKKLGDSRLNGIFYVWFLVLFGALGICIYTYLGNDPSGLSSSIQQDVYTSENISNMEWMTENLNVSNFKNGDIIPEARTTEEWLKASEEKQPAWCYVNNEETSENGNGKLYNWYAIYNKAGLAPEGWHVATDEEWQRLQQAEKNADIKKLNLWKGENYFRGWNGEFFEKQNYYWTSTEDWQTCAWAYKNSKERKFIYKGCGAFVRCVKD